MSTLPRKCAPSAMATRGETMSPSTEPPSRISTFSDALTLPLTSPRTMTVLANIWALMRPLGPIVSKWSLSSILPSTWPSIVRSSLPLSSPLMTTDLPMFTRSLSIRRGSACWATGALGCTLDATGAAAGVGWLVGLTASSRFHMKNSSAWRGRLGFQTPANSQQIGLGRAAGGESPQSISVVRNFCLVTLQLRLRAKCYDLLNDQGLHGPQRHHPPGRGRGRPDDRGFARGIRQPVQRPPFRAEG